MEKSQSKEFVAIGDRIMKALSDTNVEDKTKTSAESRVKIILMLSSEGVEVSDGEKSKVIDDLIKEKGSEFAADTAKMLGMVGRASILYSDLINERKKAGDYLGAADVASKAGWNEDACFLLDKKIETLLKDRLFEIAAAVARKANKPEEAEIYSKIDDLLRQEKPSSL